jgi:hypothetical protein
VNQPGRHRSGLDSGRRIRAGMAQKSERQSPQARWRTRHATSTAHRARPPRRSRSSSAKHPIPRTMASESPMCWRCRALAGSRHYRQLTPGPDYPRRHSTTSRTTATRSRYETLIFQKLHLLL